MSCAGGEEAADVMMCRCASCGVAEDGNINIKLKKCNACHSVRYCSVECQKEHRPQHKAECKKRAADMRDEILFKQPESSHMGDCQICCLPHSIDHKKSSLSACCTKMICNGCLFFNLKRERKEKLESKCVFCRKKSFLTGKESELLFNKRIEANDPNALRQMGTMCGAQGNFAKSMEFLTKAANLGDAESHYQLGMMYGNRLPFSNVGKDKKKERYHLEEAAIAGHPEARLQLGIVEVESKRMDRAVKHFIIAASNGEIESMKMVRKGYETGVVSKEEFASALRAHQAAIDSTKSPQRDEWERSLGGRSHQQTGKMT
mmetsp:Transcript_26106/g.38329  ORF Transcript_26106/g.38329 Transcript_26106/m.38329 type:complete len:318 (+) Transcript_26106:61-1014(+)